MKIYTISGLGADLKAFEFLEIFRDFELIELPWLIPEKKEGLKNYAKRMAKPIDPQEEFVLMGCSFGGIMAQEMCAFLKPQKLILLSTITSRRELPSYMHFAKLTKAYSWLPYSFFTSQKFLSYTFFRKIVDPRMPKLSTYFTHTNHDYLKWSIKNLTCWAESYKYDGPVLRLHGTKDIVFPSKKIEGAKFIENGTHLMIIQKAKKVSTEINNFLLNV